MIVFGKCFASRSPKIFKIFWDSYAVRYISWADLRSWHTSRPPPTPNMSWWRKKQSECVKHLINPIPTTSPSRRGGWNGWTSLRSLKPLSLSSVVTLKAYFPHALRKTTGRCCLDQQTGQSESGIVKPGNCTPSLKTIRVLSRVSDFLLMVLWWHLPLRRRLFDCGNFQPMNLSG